MYKLNNRWGRLFFCNYLYPRELNTLIHKSKIFFKKSLPTCYEVY